jgi:hypothetical protein
MMMNQTDGYNAVSGSCSFTRLISGLQRKSCGKMKQYSRKIEK